MSGVQTIAYELAEQADEPLDRLFVPAGGGGLTLAIARGFEGLLTKGKLARGPRIECVQPEGNDTIAGPLRAGATEARAVQCTSQISGLQVPTVIDGNEVIRACRASGGAGHVVSDEEVWAAQARLAREEGIFCEPAGAVALAGALRAAAAGEIPRDTHVACIVTGSGFKDSPSVERMLAGKTCPTRELADLKRR
jgi:threonine synthase